MRIGVDATCWTNTRGYGRHARSLLGALVNTDTENDYTFFTDSPLPISELPARVEVKTVWAQTPTVLAASADGHRSAQDMWRMARAMSAASLDLIFFPTIYSYVPVVSHARKIVMIHDVIAEKYPSLTLPKQPARLFWKTKVALGRFQADAVTTVSDFSRQGILEHFKMKPERVHVVGEASDPVFHVIPNARLTRSLRDLGLSEDQRQIIYVGGFAPHKNLECLVAAFANLLQDESFKNARLILVGEHKKEIFHSYAGTIKNQIERLGIGERVVFTGYLPDDELAILLNVATVCVLPSLIEGFGLPAVEAAACGCPVIATNQSPLPELLGAGGLFFEPTRQAQLEAQLLRVFKFDSLRDEMSEAGKKASGKLTWNAAAQQMLEVIRKVSTC